MRNKYCLVLDQSYQPCRIVSTKTAIHIVFSKPNVEIIEEYPDIIRSVSFQMNLPSIIRLSSGRSKNNWNKNGRDFKLLKPNKANIYARDNGQCVYCNKQLELYEATLDHCIPRSRGGLNSWDNLVLSCTECNGNKGDKIIPKPQIPKHQTRQVFFEKKLKYRVNNFPLAWLNYIGM